MTPVPDPCRKRIYGCRDAALSAIAAVAAQTGARLGALELYQCKQGCTVDESGKRAWHYGHRIGSKRKPIRNRR